ncbi:dienelactone hydrolase family protein [Alsobacter sp. SYSU M60028]|uniref:Dienelactone hydrolase family protein n=1 Tax=Alsobacter ponti TaxID=2962936 RepID=A0ABT1LGW3_9HYPH|nr:dienelactone hydrolase family protein [Alsobacter ponti]MCP8940118.1 dienelactone hydrolase family protein [Alsobacter ponti]
MPNRLAPRAIVLPDGREGVLSVPARVRGLVIFAHGSGSNRLSPRNTAVARDLQARGFATLLCDLLTEEEALDRANVFDISLLARRLGDVIAWASTEPTLTGLPLGLYGASTGAAGAIMAAVNSPHEVSAVVSRGGRPDLARAALPFLRAPTLLAVGANDTEVIALNREAREQMTCESELLIVPGASHLFEEPGALEQVSSAAVRWFERHVPNHAL